MGSGANPKASTSGFIRVNDQRCIGGLMRRLSHLAMVGLFILSRENGPAFEAYILANTKDMRADPEGFVGQHPSFFYFVIDGDTYDETQDGFLCTAAFGTESPVRRADLLPYMTKT